MANIKGTNKKQSGSLFFPFKENYENNSLQRAETVQDVISSAIRLFILTESGSRLGNPIGSFVASLIHQNVGANQLANIESELRRELTLQFPEVTFLETSFKRDLTATNVRQYLIGIRYATPITDVVELSLSIQA